MRANVNQISPEVAWRPSDQDRKNWMDLSHDHKTTFSMGQLIPFFVDEALPGDFYKIRSEVMLRFAPLYLPIMHRVNLALDYFYVPLRVLWPGYQTDGWEAFITGEAELVVPYVQQTFSQTVPGITSKVNVNEYAGLPQKLFDAGAGNDTNLLNVTAFVASAYASIYDNWYRNEQIQNKIWQPLVQGSNTAWFQADTGQDSPDGQNISLQTSVIYRNWNRDYFTSSTPTPQTGADVKIPLVQIGPLGETLKGPDQWRKLSDHTAAPAGTLVTTASGDTQTGPIAVYLDIQETAATIRQLRFAVMMTEFLERTMRAGDNYPDHQVMFWGVNPDPLKINRPKFIGGKRGRVVVSEVMSTAETDTLKVGSYAGQAMALDQSDTIEYQCFDFGIVMGIISVYPQSSYMQGIPKMFIRNERFDYPWPQFALIGDEQIQNKEVRHSFITADATFNNQIFGYNQRYYDWRYKNDLVTGRMRVQYSSFHLGRILDPEVDFFLDTQFLLCQPRVSDVFQITEGEHEIFAHIYNDVQVRRQLPKFGIPQL